MLTIALWSPPFKLPPPGEFVPAPEVEPRWGDVLLVRLTLEASDEQDIAALARDLRRRHAGCPLALWIPCAPLQAAIDAARAASDAHVRAIVGGEPLATDLLRTQLTSPMGLSAFVLRWAEDAGYLPPGVDQEDVRQILDAAPDIRTLQSLSCRRQVVARTQRSHLQQLGLPTPRAWLGLAHALHVAFFVQRNRTDSVQSLCSRLGMPTVAHMSQQFRRMFALPPSHVRELLGAEPLLYRWFQARRRP